MDKIKLAEICQKYKKRLIDECGTSAYESKHSSIHYFLDDTYSTIRKEISLLLLEVNKKEMLPTLQEFSNYLYTQVNTILNSNSKFSRKCSNQYLSLYNLVFGHLSQLQSIPDIDYIEDKPVKNIKIPKESEYNKPSVNKRQVLALMHLFKKFKLVNKDLTDTALGDSFGNLTGYKGGQLRKDFIEFKKDDIFFTEKEINELKDILVQMGKEIDKLPLK